MTDALGAFTCGGLAGNNYSAAVSPASGAANEFRFLEAPPKFELRDGDARIDGARLVVEPTLLAIEGRVIDATGMPVADVAVHAFSFERKPRSDFQLPSGSLTDEDGRFHISWWRAAALDSSRATGPRRSHVE